MKIFEKRSYGNIVDFSFEIHVNAQWAFFVVIQDAAKVL